MTLGRHQTSEKGTGWLKEGSPASSHSLTSFHLPFTTSQHLSIIIPPPTHDCQVHIPKIFLSACCPPGQTPPVAPHCLKDKVQILPKEFRKILCHSSATEQEAPWLSGTHPHHRGKGNLASPRTRGSSPPTQTTCAAKGQEARFPTGETFPSSKWVTNLHTWELKDSPTSSAANPEPHPSFHWPNTQTSQNPLLLVARGPLPGEDNATGQCLVKSLFLCCQCIVFFLLRNPERSLETLPNSALFI